MFRFDFVRVSMAHPFKITDAWEFPGKDPFSRLLKRMAIKYGCRHEAPLAEVYWHHERVEDLSVAEVILAQVDGLYRRGSTPRKILIGACTFSELASLSANTAAHGTYERIFGFPNGDRIYGLPFTVVPDMDGVLVLDDTMLEVQ